MFKYCPACASPRIRCEQDRVFRCPECGFTYYHNTAAATSGVICTNQGILMTVREKDPGRGKLDLPGGFVDPGEGAIEGFRRECREELGWDPGPEPTLFASFPNIYPYKGISYHTCDLFFKVDAADLSEKDLHLEPQEITGIRFVPLKELDPDAIAFDSVRRALAFFAEKYNR